jgi:acetoin utilization deacetylase AcuC-like enzyme
MMWDVWSAALDQACQRITEYDADVIVVSLGVNAFKDDPIPSSNKQIIWPSAVHLPWLNQHCLSWRRLSSKTIGVNTVNVLEGFGRLSPPPTEPEFYTMQTISTCSPAPSAAQP